MEEKVSVVIPTYNRAEMLVDCIASVLADGYPNLEIIVVDDCSPDDTGGAVARRFGGVPSVRYTRNPKNLNLAGSRNRGAELSTGNYIFFLDDDNLLVPGAIGELLSAFRRHPAAGAVAPLVINRRKNGEEDTIWTTCADFNRWTSLPVCSNEGLPFSKLPKEPAEYLTTYSQNGFMVRREALEKAGGMDESFKIMFDESDFGWKLREAGYEFYISARALTNHLGYLESGCVSQMRLLGVEKEERSFVFARNRIKFARKHFNFLQAQSVTFIFAPLLTVYYCAVALKNRRPEIAWAYFKGTVFGILGLY